MWLDASYFFSSSFAGASASFGSSSFWLSTADVVPLPVAFFPSLTAEEVTARPLLAGRRSILFVGPDGAAFDTFAAAPLRALALVLCIAARWRDAALGLGSGMTMIMN